jgi:hypothetical protein
MLEVKMRRMVMASGKERAEVEVDCTKLRKEKHMCTAPVAIKAKHQNIFEHILSRVSEI